MRKSAVFLRSDEIVIREIEGHFILIPLKYGPENQEDELFTLNNTARSIWKKLDGKKTIGQIIQELAKEYVSSADTVADDVQGLLKELAKRRFIVRIENT